ncbi:B-type lectin plumieribetin-like [Osmerus mordax]|uniref:B-type lectin plumieribetin-like n=1 Tax=Osmerus mordax TaxID=8014 RepID=UPI0035102FF0
MKDTSPRTPDSSGSPSPFQNHPELQILQALQVHSSLTMSRNYMSKFDELRKGDYIMSNNHEWKAVFQEDGNFIIYGWKPMWNSDTAGQRDAWRLCMQDDCNLVMYKRDNKMMWQTKSQASGGFKMCHLHLRNDGTMVVERDGEEVWSSAQSKGFKN